MSGLDQVIVAAAPGDAATSAALVYRDLLRRQGPSEIFARYLDPRLAGDVLPLDVLRARRPDASGRLLLHAAIGDPVVFPFLAERPERLTMLYHNLSPAAAFDEWDPKFAAELRVGRTQVAALAGRVDRVLTPSAFNARDLVELGYASERITVVPLVIDLAFGSPAHGADEADPEGPVLLFVGQQYPHKRVELLIQAIHVVATFSLPTARLVIVGPSRLPAYRQALEELARRLRAPVDFVGEVDDAKLGECYRRASVFVTASDHEGFCVPVLEAMAAGVPVVVRDAGALAETAGGAAIVLPAGAGPELLAEAVTTVMSDPVLRRRLVDAGLSRAAEVDPDTARSAFLEAIGR